MGNAFIALISQENPESKDRKRELDIKYFPFIYYYRLNVGV